MACLYVMIANSSGIIVEKAVYLGCYMRRDGVDIVKIIGCGLSLEYISVINQNYIVAAGTTPQRIDIGSYPRHASFPWLTGYVVVRKEVTMHIGSMQQPDCAGDIFGRCSHQGYKNQYEWQKSSHIHI